MISTQDRLRLLKQRTEQMSDFKIWKPQEGEAIAGAIVGSGSFMHPLYGEQQTILLDTGGGAGVFSVILSKYLRVALTRQGALHGDFVGIKFVERRQSKHGQYNHYGVVVDRN